MRTRHVRSLAKFLADQPSASEYLAHALTVALDKRDGQALIRLLADPTIGASNEMSTPVKRWLGDIESTAVTALYTESDSQVGEPSKAELTALVQAYITTALGEAVLGLSTWTPLE